MKNIKKVGLGRPDSPHHTREEINHTVRSSSIGLITRQKDPKVLETPLDRVDSFFTPTESFYVRSHAPTPKLEPDFYRLQVDGAVRNPVSLSYEQLRRMPAEKRVALLECAGNSRVFLVPPGSGSPVGTGRSWQRGMDRRASERFTGARRFGRRRLRDRARRARSRNTEGGRFTARPGSLCS
jgi:Oxidoreductase molybdopterin binding domain